MKKIKYNLEYADNGVVINDPETNEKRVIEYAEADYTVYRREQENAPISEYLGKRLMQNIVAANEELREDLQGWDIEIILTPKK